MKYKLVRNLPVARFWYKGNHTHPVRRTVLITESTSSYIKGYELRDGKEIRTNLSNSPIKTYCRSKIAKGENLRKENKKNIDLKKSTLIRKPLLDLIECGA